MLGEQRAREELAIFLLVEPGAFDVEELEAGHADGERERVDRELRDRLVGARIGLVIEDMHGVVSDLQKIDVAGDASAAPHPPRARCRISFECGDVVFGEPDGNLDRDRARVIREHEILQCLVPQLVVADGRDDERGGLGRRVLFAIDDEAVDIGECGLRLRGARFRIVLSSEELVRAVTEWFREKPRALRSADAADCGAEV